jgi:CHAT domain-containing protein
MLFGPLSPEFQRKPRWLLALDAPLFDLPFAALAVDHGAGRPVFLIERHSLETTPGAGMLASASDARRGSPDGPFLGIADPVYNKADPRWPKPAATHGIPSLSRAPLAAQAAEDADDLHLARLAGSAREIEACAKAWGGGEPPQLLQGAAASRRHIEMALNSHPAVLHFATHVLHSVQHPRNGLIVLSLNDTGQNEILSSAEIATWRLDGALVSLSGCSSGSADALPGTGLMGLTRAGLAAGAQAVVASRWPAPDDAGALFSSLYGCLHRAPKAGVASALQRAQIEMIRSQSWRSNPRYWGAYFVAGK